MKPVATVCLALGAACAVSHVRADIPLVQSPDDLQTIVSHSAKTILSACHSWPAQFVTSPKDQAGGRHLQDGSSILVKQLTGSLFNVDSRIQPRVYGASFLRLLDSVGTADPLVSNNKLLGLAQLIDPNELHLWGSNLAIVKYDCASMLNLLAQANSSYAIPLASLDAAFKASSGVTSNESAIFMAGAFQSPFDTFYTSQDQPERRVYAAFKAIDWRLRTATPGFAQYVSTADFLTITDTISNTQLQSVLSNFRGGAKIPFLDISTTVSGQLSSALQSNAQSYVTYLWNPTWGTLPPLPTLSITVASNIPPLVPDRDTVSPGATVSSLAAFNGWPNSLCSSPVWRLQVSSAAYTAGLLTMTPSTTTTGMPTCTIDARVKRTLDDSPGVSDPLITLVSRQSADVSIPFRLSKPLTPSGKTRVTVLMPRAGWTILVDSGGQKANVQWSSSLHIDPPSGTSLISATIVRGSFKCKPRDQTQEPWDITDVSFGGSPAKYSVTGGSRDQDIPMPVMLSLLGATTYNETMPSPPYKRTCTLVGTLTVITTTDSNGNQQTDQIDVQASEPIVYPDVLALPSINPPATTTSSAEPPSANTGATS